MSEVTIDKVPYVSLCDIKYAVDGKNTCDSSVDSSASKDSKTLMAVNRNIPIDDILSSWERNPRRCKQKLNTKEESSDEVPYVSLCAIKSAVDRKNTYDSSVDSSASKDSKTLMAVNRNIPIDDILSSWERNPRRCKQKLNTKEESSDEEENKPVKKRVVRVVPKRNKAAGSDDSSPSEKFNHSSDEDYKPSKKKIVKIVSRSKSSKYKKDSESESQSESSDEKTPYEKMIEKRRAEHKALLEELKLNEIKAGLIEAVNSFEQKPKRVKKPGSVKSIRPKPKVYEPTRRSKRLANVAPDLSEEALYQKALKEATEEAKKETEPPIPSNQTFKEALYYEESYEECMKNIICQEVKSDQKFYLYDKPALKALTLKSTNIAKVTPARVSAASWCPVEKLIIAAGDKYGNYGIWNMESESEPYLFRIHRSGVTCMQFSPYNHSQIISSSYDGTLRCCDVVQQMFTEVYDMFAEVECTFFDFLSETTYIVSQTDGQVVLVDKRARKTSEKKHQCHDSSIKSVNVHPVNKNVFVTASRSREIHLWDLRKLQEKPISSILHHKRSINSAFFSPVTGNSLLSTSFDNTLCIFDTTNLTGPIRLRASTKHDNNTGRWLSVFRATWLPNSDDTFVVGNMTYPRRAQVLDSNMNIYHELISENLTAITSVNVFHPFRPAFAGCNSSGRISVFT